MIKWLWTDPPEGQRTYRLAVLCLISGVSISMYGLARGSDPLGLAGLVTGLIGSALGAQSWKSVNTKRAVTGNYPAPKNVAQSAPPATPPAVNIDNSGGGS